MTAGAFSPLRTYRVLAGANAPDQHADALHGVVGRGWGDIYRMAEAVAEFVQGIG